MALLRSQEGVLSLHMNDYHPPELHMDIHRLNFNPAFLCHTGHSALLYYSRLNYTTGKCY